MSVRTFKYICSLGLVLITGLAIAQDTVRQTKTVKDTAVKVSKYWPTGVRFGTDIITLLKSHSGHNFNGWEANADVDLYRNFVTLDYGRWARHDSVTTTQASYGKGIYENSGYYFRIGTDINFLLKDPERNMFFIGFRYGHAGFNESLEYTYVDPTYQTISRRIVSNHLTGHWGEITTGLRVKIFPGFWMGYTARMKVAPGVHGGNTQLKPFDMPGYGLVSHSTWWGFNYQLFWRVPIPKIK